MTNFVQIQSGNFRALVRPENLAKVEDKLAKVKPPKPGKSEVRQTDTKRYFPIYEPGMSTADYVSEYERKNSGLSFTKPYLGLNEYPAAQYDPLVPLCVEDANPDYIAGVDDAPVKAKRVKRDPKVERIATLEDLLLQALPFVEDCQDTGAYNAYKLNDFIGKIRAALDLK